MNDPRIVAIVQARFGSSRLPGKALRPLAGRPMVLHVLERAAAMGFSTWLATSDRDSDTLLAETAIAAGYPVYRGAERDVLRRMRETAEVAQADVVVRVTGDCPLFAPDVGLLVVQQLALAGWAGISTNDTTKSGYPDGLDVEVFPLDLLRQADFLAAQPQHDADAKAWAEREHVTPRIRRIGPHHVLKASDNWRQVKLSVDESADFERVAQVLAHRTDGDLSWAATQAAYRRWQQKEQA